MKVRRLMCSSQPEGSSTPHHYRKCRVVRHGKIGRSTSVEGQSRPNWAVRVMSGLPPVATVERTSLHFAYGPTRDSCTAVFNGLLHHLSARSRLRVLLRILAAFLDRPMRYAPSAKEYAAARWQWRQFRSANGPS